MEVMPPENNNPKPKFVNREWKCPDGYIVVFTGELTSCFGPITTGDESIKGFEW
jgi:hypothetical protein